MTHLVSVHAALSAVPGFEEDPLKNVRSSPMFNLLLDKFAALLYELPKPVIFILDTCEELAKLEPAGAILSSVEATFLILEALHDRVLKFGLCSRDAAFSHRPAASRPAAPIINGARSPNRFPPEISCCQ